MQIHLRKQWQIANGHDPDEVIERKGKVGWIRQRYAPFARFLEVALGPVTTQQLPEETARIHRYEDRVPKPDQRRRYTSQQQIGYVVGIANDFRQAPTEQSQR